MKVITPDVKNKKINKEILTELLNQAKANKDAISKQQQGKKFWRLIRLLLFTTSGWHKALHNTGAYIKSKMEPFYYGDYTLYGTKAEDRCDQMAELNMIQKFKSEGYRVEIIHHGLIIDDNDPYLATSLDAEMLLYDTRKDKNKRYCLEYKCFHETVEEKKVASVRGFMQEEYYYQVQGQMHVTGIEDSYFFNYSPEKLQFEHHVYNEQWVKEVIPELKRIYWDLFAPELYKIKGLFD